MFVRATYIYVCIHVCVYELHTCMCVQATYMYVCTSYIHVCVYELHTCICVRATYMYVCIHVSVYKLHTCMCVQAAYMYVCTSYMHVMYMCYVIPTSMQYVLCPLISPVPPPSSPSLLSLPLTSLPHPYLSPSFTLFSKAILDGRHEMAMLLWSSPNHSPSPPSRAPHGYHIDSMGCSP